MYFFLLLEQDRAGHMLTQWRAFKSSYLVHLILCISPYHSLYLRSHHLSLPRFFYSRLKTYLFHKPFPP